MNKEEMWKLLNNLPNFSLFLFIYIYGEYFSFFLKTIFTVMLISVYLAANDILFIIDPKCTFIFCYAQPLNVGTLM